MTSYPYQIVMHKNGFGADVAFKEYPLSEGQTRPHVEIATAEEVQAWEAFQESMLAKPVVVEVVMPEQETEQVNGTGKKRK